MSLRKCLAFIAASICLTPYAYADALYVAGWAPSDNRDCTRDLPCQSLDFAMFKATSGDDIICIAAPKPQPFAILKSINIDCAAQGGVTVRDTALTQGGGILINLPANDPLGMVRLRGIVIDGGRPGFSNARAIQRGIDIQAAPAVFIDDSQIVNWTQQGIYDRRTGGQTRLYVKNTTISGGLGVGIVAGAQAVGATVLDNVSLLNNAYGLAAASGNNVVVSRSTISGNTTAGVHADGGAQINLLNSVLSHNTTNVNAYGSVRLQENTIQFSNVAIQGGGAISLGSNRFAGNGALGSAPVAASGAPADVIN